MQHQRRLTQLFVLIFLAMGLCLGSFAPVVAQEEQSAIDPMASQEGPPVVDGPSPRPPLRASMKKPLRVTDLPVVVTETPQMPTTFNVQDLAAIEVAPDEKWIVVDLSEQRMWAYEGTEEVRSFVVSTGLPGTPTVTGVFRMWVRTPVQDMWGGRAGDAYYLEDVQWVQYFYEDYSFHGTYWHNNFGQPMSHGCVNMTNEDAKWLFDWTLPDWDGEQGWLYTDESNNTLVVVHE